MEIDISNQVIEDILITALEGGSNSWYFLPDITMATKHYKGTTLAGSEKVIRAVLDHNEVIPVHDAEEEEIKLGDLSQENIKRGIQLFFDREDLSFTADMDAGEADTFFQYVVMGELVFG